MQSSVQHYAQYALLQSIPVIVIVILITITVLEDTVAKPLSHCILWLFSASSSPTTQSRISSISLLVLALISKLFLVSYSSCVWSHHFQCCFPCRCIDELHWGGRIAQEENWKLPLLYTCSISLPGSVSSSLNNNPDRLGQRSLCRGEVQTVRVSSTSHTRV